MFSEQVGGALGEHGLRFMDPADHRHSGVAFSDVSQTDSSRVWPTAKDPARQALVTALLHPLPLNTALGLLLEAVMRNAHLVKNSATPGQVKAPKVTLVGIVSQVKAPSQQDKSSQVCL